MIIGVTGGIGTGKTAFSEFLGIAGARLIIADDLVHELYEKDESLIKAIGERFGSETVRNGMVDRTKLSEVVFGNMEKLKKLNRLVHKRVGEEIASRIHRQEGENLIVIDAPIPVKRGFLEFCDKVVVLKSSRDKRIERIKKRSGLTGEQIEKVFRAQPDDREYEKIADIVIENNGSLDELKDKAVSVIKELSP